MKGRVEKEERVCRGEERKRGVGVGVELLRDKRRVKEQSGDIKRQMQLG